MSNKLMALCWHDERMYRGPMAHTESLTVVLLVLSTVGS